ncbi:MAG: hypothetical protein C4570_06360 [Ammonifex sp.]|nr:MAG: hypothetical protein C4570_06360 [Ammonifex sp.]
MNAFKNNVTAFDETNMNELISFHDFALIYEGSQVDAKAGAGTAEFDNASYDHALRFTATGVTEIARLELELIKHGTGADLQIEIRSGFDPGGTTEGTLLKTVVVPKEFLPAGRSYWSIPLDLTGLTAGNQYWIVVRGAGDATNHFHAHGETTPDANYPAYYRLKGGSGAWTLENSIHFKVFSGESGELKHRTYPPSGHSTLEFSGEVLSKVYRYLPPSDTTAGGIRQIVTYTFSGEYLKKGEVA